MSDRDSQSSDYRDRIHPWCIVRHLPDARSVVVDRFRKRGEAEAYLRTLNRLLPNITHSLIFDAEMVTNRPTDQETC